MIIDAVIDLRWGDCAKAKTSSYLLENNHYDVCMRINGGTNKGGAVYKNGKRYIIQSFTAGVLNNVKCIIGSPCILNVNKFFQEINELEKDGFEVSKLVKVAKNVHIVSDEHLNEDANETRIGSTRQGISPCFAGKAMKTNKRAEDIPELKDFIIDTYEEFYVKNDYTILCEGAQGYGLDIDHGSDYPYVTSSSCGAAAILLSGLPHTAIRHVYGAVKAYDTYVGARSFQPTDNEIFKQIALLGKETGNVSGRTRQCNYLDLTDTMRAFCMNGCTHLVVNKMDVLQELDHWKMIIDGNIFSFTEQSFKQKLIDTFPGIEVIFSYTPYGL